MRTRSHSSQPLDTGAVAGGTPDPARRPARPFVVPVAALRKMNGTTRDESRTGVIGDLAAVGVTVPEGEPVTVEVTVSSYPGGIAAVGSVRARWRGECRRCGGPVGGTLVSHVRERYAPTGGRGADEEAYLLEGDELDLEPLARDAVLLELPLAPLCSPGCLGLCPQCGANWNEEGCGCAPPGDPRWSVLDGLRDLQGDNFA
ncbi:MAG: YceD family protein [Acidimicrobiales bacterium]